MSPRNEPDRPIWGAPPEAPEPAHPREPEGRPGFARRDGGVPAPEARPAAGPGQGFGSFEG